MRVGTPQFINENNLPHLQLVGEPTVASPNEADWWYDGTSLNFRNSSSTIDLLVGGGGLQFAMGVFSKAMTEASGTVAYTGTGFLPTHIFIQGGVTGSKAAFSVGMDDGTIKRVFTNNSENAAGDFIFRTTDSIDITTASGARQLALVDSFDSNGFTLDWTKVGSPTGTANFTYMAYR